MTHRGIIAAATLLSIQVGLTGIGTVAAAESNTITLDRPVHFQAAAGGMVVAAPDDYMVIGVEQGRLLLVPEKGKVPLVITAVTAQHEENVSNPVARAASTGPDEHRVLLLLPSGERREAIGSYTGAKRTPPPAVAAAPQAGPTVVTPPVIVPTPSPQVAPPSNFAFNGPASQTMPRSGMVPDVPANLPVEQQILAGLHRLENRMQALEQRISTIELKLDSKFIGGGMR
jgi:hypothetical protein